MVTTSCDKNCIHRTSTCHSTCEKYKQFVKEKRQEQIWLHKMNNKTKINRSEFIGTSVKRQNKKNPLAYNKPKKQC